jgi:DNA-binding NarL/FixJ family response regulator
MSNTSPLRRPNLGEPLRVMVLSRDPLVRQALVGQLKQLGRDVALEERESHAHVALLDVGAVTSPALGPGRKVDPDVAKASRHQLDDALAQLATLKIPAVVLLADEAQARAAVSKGARGAVRRTADVIRIKAALDAVASGLTVVDFALVQGKADAEPETHLTPREQEVLELLVQGFSNRRIAKRLGISEHTAKFHVNGILLKLGAGTRTEAVVVAARRGLVMI